MKCKGVVMYGTCGVMCKTEFHIKSSSTNNCLNILNIAIKQKGKRHRE